MNLIIRYLLILILFGSCNSKPIIKEFITKKSGANEVQLKSEILIGESRLESFKSEDPETVEKINNILQSVVNETDVPDNINELQKDWNNLKIKVNPKNLSFDASKKWFELTGFLFQVTGNATLGTELEHIYFQNFSKLSDSLKNEIEKIVVPFIFTRNIDFVHVNLFLTSEIKYSHTFGGYIIMNLETDYPKSGKILLRLNLEKKRYAEINIRIPEWAEGTTVEVKGVKFLANPGEYCQVAKSWLNNDVIEINFPQPPPEKFN